MEATPLLRQAFPVPALQPEWEAALLKALGYAEPDQPSCAAPNPESGSATRGRLHERRVLGLRYG